MEGQGPTIGELNRRRQEREIAAANQTGQDILTYVVGGNIFSEGETGSKPKSTRRCGRDMHKARLTQAGKGFMKIRDFKTESSTKKTFKVANSERGHASYDVVVTNTPSCTCTDFRRHKNQVLCKHILFVVVHVLQVNDIDGVLRSRYIGDGDLKAILARNIPNQFLQKKEKRSRYVNLIFEREVQSCSQFLIRL